MAACETKVKYLLSYNYGKFQMVTAAITVRVLKIRYSNFDNAILC